MHQCLGLLVGVFKLNLLSRASAVVTNAMGDATIQRLPVLCATDDNRVIAFEAMA
ncbi:hypothetical protein ACCD10_16120 [Pseudomonas sp. Pseusp122]